MADWEADFDTIKKQAPFMLLLLFFLIYHCINPTCLKHEAEALSTIS